MPLALAWAFASVRPFLNVFPFGSTLIGGQCLLTVGEVVCVGLEVKVVEVLHPATPLLCQSRGHRIAVLQRKPGHFGAG